MRGVETALCVEPPASASAFAKKTDDQFINASDPRLIASYHFDLTGIRSRLRPGVVAGESRRFREIEMDVEAIDGGVMLRS